MSAAAAPTSFASTGANGGGETRSYFEYNDLPGIFERLAIASGKEVYVRREVVSGRYLDFFAENTITEQVIQEQDWDYMLLQGGCQPALKTLKAKIEAVTPSTAVTRPGR